MLLFPSARPDYLPGIVTSRIALGSVAARRERQIADIIPMHVICKSEYVGSKQRVWKA